MKSERVIVIGDVHGCLDMLKRLMDKIRWRPDKDRLIFLGDYIDRGESPKQVVDYILDLTSHSSKIECLIGNHESLFLNYLSGGDSEIFLSNGGWRTVESYMLEKPEDAESMVPSDHMAFYESLETFIELEDYYVVHAGFKPGLDIKEQSPEDMIWIRDKFIYTDHDFGKRVIFGHTPFHEPFIMENKIGLDTGAVYGNRLTCLELPAFRFHFVEA
jgi:serine/threonine protein phosphatase 1